MAVSEFENTVAKLLLENPDKWYTGYKDVYFEFVQQVGCRYKNGGHGIIDLVVHVYRPNYKQTGNVYNFEIKSSVSDLNSGRGLNLFGMYNYVVYPHIPITTLPGILTFDTIDKKLKDIGCEHAGIIGVTSDNDFTVERRAKRYYGDGMPMTIKAHKHKIPGV